MALCSNDVLNQSVCILMLFLMIWFVLLSSTNKIAAGFMIQSGGYLAVVYSLCGFANGWTARIAPHLLGNKLGRKFLMSFKNPNKLKKKKAAKNNKLIVAVKTSVKKESKMQKGINKNG